VGSTPLGLAVNQATELVFVANEGDATASVIDGATCNATITAGCGGTLAIIPVGGGPGGPALNIEP